MKKLFLPLFIFSLTFTAFSMETEEELPGTAIVTSETVGLFSEKENSESEEVNSENQNETLDETVEKAKVPIQMDFELRTYLIPSSMGYVAGSGAYMKLREDYSLVSDSYSFVVEDRVSFADINNFSFATAFSLNGYMEYDTTDENKYYCFSASLGGGVYYHFFKEYDLSLTGMYVYLYPIYSLPFCILNNKDAGRVLDYSANDFAWKVAAEIGLTANIFTISLSPYMRTALAWTKSGKVKAAVDFGISIGLYIPDRYYIESVYGEY